MEIINPSGAVHKAYNTSKKINDIDKSTPENIPENKEQFKPSGIQKAAILVIALGSKASSELFKHLTPEERERLLAEVIRLKNISQDQVAPVIKEISELIEKDNLGELGGTYYANYLLEKSFGKTKAKDVISHLKTKMNKKPLEILEKLDDSQIAQLIQDEHPQIIATILFNMKAQQASKVLKLLPKQLLPQITKKIAKIKTVEPSFLETIGQGLKEKFEKNKEYMNSTVQVGGVDKLAEILQYADRSTEDVILNHLNSENPDLANEVQRKIFLFEDIIRLSDIDLQKLLFNLQDLTVMRALKGTSETIRTKFLMNMSEDRSKEILKGMEVLGILKLQEIQSAQNAIVKLIRQMIDRGLISLSRGVSERDYFIE